MEEKSISPEWLELVGFMRVTGQNEDDFDQFPSAFNVNYGEDDLCYLEKKLDRKQFCIVLTPNEFEGDKFFTFSIWIQEDIGCGFIEIPNQFIEMTEHHFSLIYEGIRREKLIAQ